MLVSLTLDFQQPYGKKPFESIVRKAENAGNQHFLTSIFSFPYNVFYSSVVNFNI